MSHISESNGVSSRNRDLSPVSGDCWGRRISCQSRLVLNRVLSGCKPGASVLLALSLSGCALPEVLDIGYVSGSDEGFSQAVVAADAWNSACGAELVRVHRGEGAISLTERQGMHRNAYGETKLERPNPFGPKQATEIWFTAGMFAEPTLAHEFGHALGLEHSADGVMQPGGQNEALDPDTNFRSLLPGLITEKDCALVSKVER